VLVRERKQFRGQKKEDDIDYEGGRIKVPRPPQFFILDSRGYVHLYRFYDTRYAAPKLSMFIQPLSMREFIKKKEFLKGKLLNSEKRLRSKSQMKIQIVSSPQKRNRSKSQLQRKSSFSETKALYFFSCENIWSSIKIYRPEEKQKIIEDLKKTVADKKALENQSQNPFKNFDNPFALLKKTEETPSASLFKQADNPFTSVKKMEGVSSSSLFSQGPVNSLFKKTDNPFLPAQKTKEKSTSSLFSATQTGFGNSLFNQNFQKPQVKGFQSNSLFSSTKKTDSGIDSANLFSSNTSEKTVIKVFTTTEDPIKRKAFLFLNKFESDVLFKVEKEEFPAHKSILSEKCRFFKNMFASKDFE